MTEAKKTTTANETSETTTAKKDKNLFRFKTFEYNVVNGTLPLGNARRIVKDHFTTHETINGKTVATVDTETAKKCLQAFDHWQKSVHGDKVRQATSDVSVLMADMAGAGYDVTGLRLKANGGITVTFDPPATARPSTIQGIIDYARRLMGALALR